MNRPPTQQEIDYGCALERPSRRQRAMLVLILTWAAVAVASAFVAWELTP